MDLICTGFSLSKVTTNLYKGKVVVYSVYYRCTQRKTRRARDLYIGGYTGYTGYTCLKFFKAPAREKLIFKVVYSVYSVYSGVVKHEGHGV